MRIVKTVIQHTYKFLAKGWVALFETSQNKIKDPVLKDGVGTRDSVVNKMLSSQAWECQFESLTPKFKKKKSKLA